MKQIDLYSTIEQMLLTKPELRKTENIGRVVWNIYHLIGALDEGTLSFDNYLLAPSHESITRKIREVKSDNHWKDETAKKQENAYHSKYGNPAFTPNPSSNAQNRAVRDVRRDIGYSYPQELERPKNLNHKEMMKKLKDAIPDTEAGRALKERCK